MWTINRLLTVMALVATVLVEGCGCGPEASSPHALPIDPTKVEGTWEIEVADMQNHSIVNHDEKFVSGTIGQKFVISKDGFHFAYKNYWPFVMCDRKVFSCVLVAPDTIKPFGDHWTSPNLGPMPNSIYHITSKCSDGVFQSYFMSRKLDEITMNWDGVWLRAKRVR